MTYALSATADELQKAISAATSPILVDFYAEWCGPCKGMAPGLEAFAQEQQGNLTVMKIDIDQNQEAAMNFQVRAVPTLLLVKDGKVLGRHAGALPKQGLMQFVDKHLA